MSISTKITPKIPGPEEILHFRLMADLPSESVENLAEALVSARSYQALSIWQDARARFGLARYIANTAVRLAVAKAKDRGAFRLKLDALSGLQFPDTDQHVGETIALLLRAESRSLGIEVPESKDTPGEVPAPV